MSCTRMSTMIRCVLVLTLLASVRAYRRRADDSSELHSAQMLAALMARVNESEIVDAGDKIWDVASSLQAALIDEPAYSWWEASQQKSSMSDACFAKLKSLSMCEDIESKSTDEQHLFRIYFFDCNPARGLHVLDEQRSFKRPSECTDSAKDTEGKPLSYGCCRRSKEL
eukprot:TRINITY_DN8536_c0_g1_i1.p1 TRINITY_DN8536_c0_g1~~TRINITY_DN8536_c0_g1_i1.p1  ORF type:complete len:169 (-),score=15.71 TRINITY_DN8536_c0_g1_i1:307-813(-)